MSRFSDRIGATERPTTLQVDSVSTELRNSLWNVLSDSYPVDTYGLWRRVAQVVGRYHIKVSVDEIPDNDYQGRAWIKQYYFNLSRWYEIYNFLEFIVAHHEQVHRSGAKKSQLISVYNFVLERELSGYRFINGVLSPVSDKTEAEALSEGIEAAAQGGYAGAHEHLSSAVQLLGKKPMPDFRNSVKESISAVESIATVIAGTTDLKQALRILRDKGTLHGAMAKGFLNLYGYTSDADGIRHSIAEESSVTFADAKYMLVSCTAFVHFLIQKADEANLIGEE